MPKAPSTRVTETGDVNAHAQAILSLSSYLIIFQHFIRTTYAWHADENKWELHYTDDIHRSTDNVKYRT
jgi:hypothetical protein